MMTGTKVVTAVAVACVLAMLVTAIVAEVMVSQVSQRPFLDLVDDCSATPNDGLDDSAQIQACVDQVSAAGAGTVYIPPGVFDVAYETHAACQGSANCSVNLVGLDNLSIRGAGPASVIRKLGAGGGPTADWYTFRLGDNTDVEFSDFMVDGNRYGIAEVGEQTHEFHMAVSSEGNVRRARFHRLTIARSRGDGIRSVGSHLNVASEVSISDVHFDDNKRGGIGVQRGSVAWVVSSCVFTGGTDQQIDFEPTSDGEVAQFSITGNVFRGALDRVAVTLGGGPDHHGRSTFSGNTVEGGLHLFNNFDLAIHGNVIAAKMSSGDAVVSVRKHQNGIVISGNVIKRLAGSSPGPVVKLSHHGTGFPVSTVVSDNIIEQYVVGGALEVQTSRRLAVSGNSVALHGPASGTGISMRTFGQDSHTVSIHSNVVWGPWAVGVSLSTNASHLASSTVAGNTIHGSATGILLSKGAGDFVDPPEVVGNSLATTGLPVSAGQQTFNMGGNARDVATLSGWGAPAGACIRGSRWWDRQGSQWWSCGAQGWSAEN